MEVSDSTRIILDRCREMGFALAGICKATSTDHADKVRAWLDSGSHGEMEYLTRTLDLRLDPTRFVPGAQSIICVADRYWRLSDSAMQVPASEAIPTMWGRVARYARGKDYHRIMRDRLGKFCRAMVREFPGHRFRSCVDTAPVLEREHASRAGLGAIGKNTMLIERTAGSWLLLGEVITTLPLQVSAASEPDPCGSCTRCIEACPTDAIAEEGWSVDATKCISYLTIEHRSAIDPRFHEAMGNWMFGCDICQEVCPHNQHKSQNLSLPLHPAYAPRRSGFDLLEILNWSEEQRTQAMVNSALKRARLEMFKRNAIIALGNSVTTSNIASKVLARLQLIVDDATEHSLVRETARITVQRLTNRQSGSYW